MVGRSLLPASQGYDGSEEVRIVVMIMEDEGVDEVLIKTRSVQECVLYLLFGFVGVRAQCSKYQSV